MPPSESIEGAAMWYVAGYSTHLPDIYGESSITVVGGSCLIFKDGLKVGVVMLDEGARALVLSALSSGLTKKRRRVVGPNRWLTVEYDDRGGILLTLTARPWYVDGESISVFVEEHDAQCLVGAITNGPVAMES